MYVTDNWNCAHGAKWTKLLSVIDYTKKSSAIADYNFPILKILIYLNFQFKLLFRFSSLIGTIESKKRRQNIWFNFIGFSMSSLMTSNLHRSAIFMTLLSSSSSEGSLFFLYEHNNFSLIVPWSDLLWIFFPTPFHTSGHFLHPHPVRHAKLLVAILHIQLWRSRLSVRPSVCLYEYKNIMKIIKWTKEDWSWNKGKMERDHGKKWMLKDSRKKNLIKIECQS